LERLKQGRTVIVISHRSTTLAGCSALLTIDGGRVVADTTPAPVQARPARASPTRAPAHGVSEKRRENLLAHPAVQAWCQLNPDHVVPDRITPAKFKPNKPRPNLAVYRLEGVGADGAAVIAKRCTRGGGQIERTIYERILPHVPLPGPRYHGQMRATRDVIRDQVDNPAFSTADVAFLDVLVARFDELDEDWDRLVRTGTGLPPTLIHGDFNGKNLRMQASPQGLRVGAFDWEDAGWAVPAVDLAQAVDPSCHISASPDLATYW